MSYPDDFLAFWASTLKRGGKMAAFKAWTKLKEAGDLPGLADLKAAYRHSVWDNGWNASSVERRKWVPHVSTWLNGYGWEAWEDAQEEAAEAEADALSADLRFLEWYDRRVSEGADMAHAAAKAERVRAGLGKVVKMEDRR